MMMMMMARPEVAVFDPNSRRMSILLDYQPWPIHELEGDHVGSHRLVGSKL